MREIKFRAWTGERIIEDVASNMFEVELMQYTGLKDANGVDIYEGDIIYHDSIGIGFVEYRDNQAAYKIVFKGTTRKWFVDMLDREYGLISVIGNIHENPELLK